MSFAVVRACTRLNLTGANMRARWWLAGTTLSQKPARDQSLVLIATQRVSQTTQWPVCETQTRLEITLPTLVIRFYSIIHCISWCTLSRLRVVKVLYKTLILSCKIPFTNLCFTKTLLKSYRNIVQKKKQLIQTNNCTY